MSDRTFMIIIASLPVITVILIGISGSTFGARCDRMFPDDARAADECVYKLSHGVRP